MKTSVYTGAQMKAVDRYAIETCGIPGLRLMENAAASIVSEMEKRISLAEKNCVILCGRGNNGGDGFAAACMLVTRCAMVQIVCLAPEDTLSPDAAHYYAQASLYGIEIIRDLDAALAAIAQADIVVDALYGFGFRGALSSADAMLVSAVNASNAFVVSADIPSGVSADASNVEGVCIQANVTVTFTGCKLSAILFDSCSFYGEIAIADIGIPAEAKQSVKPAAEVIMPKTALAALGTRRRNAHKGDFGKVFVLGGSRGMSGAVYMSAQAALKSGAGLVCAGVPACLSEIMEIKTTEVMTLALSEENGGLQYDAKAIRQANVYDVLAFGMGVGREYAVQTLLNRIIAEVEKPIVLDADGLYALAQNVDVLSGHRQPIVITPHSGEMARLLGVNVAQIEADRIEYAKKFAAEYNVYVILKGAYTVVAAPDGQVAVNRFAGNSGMATAGSGDVLAGICASLLSRTMDMFSALQAAVYIHALAGDLAAEDKGEDGMSACDMLYYLPYAIKKTATGILKLSGGFE